MASLQEQVAAIQAKREAAAIDDAAERRHANREALRERFVAAFGIEPSGRILSSGQSLEIGDRGVSDIPERDAAAFIHRYREDYEALTHCRVGRGIQ